jgi:hypothetical protein
MELREYVIFLTATQVGMDCIGKEVAKYEYVQSTLDNEAHLGMLYW